MEVPPPPGFYLAGELSGSSNGNPRSVDKSGEKLHRVTGLSPYTVTENTGRFASTQVIAVFVMYTEVFKTGEYEALTVLEEGW
ncbi:hypothetical protein V8C44DRAFT_313305 [Trichoderma aethiopicum]